MVICMRTTLHLPVTLIDEARAALGFRSKTDTVVYALREVVRRSRADDLKALYFEGRLATKPGASGDEIARWFWSETAAGQLLRRVRDRLDASDDPRSKAAAFGVAR